MNDRSVYQFTQFLEQLNLCVNAHKIDIRTDLIGQRVGTKEMDIRDIEKRIDDNAQPMHKIIQRERERVETDNMMIAAEPDITGRKLNESRQLVIAEHARNKLNRYITKYANLFRKPTVSRYCGNGVKFHPDFIQWLKEDDVKKFLVEDKRLMSDPSCLANAYDKDIHNRVGIRANYSNQNVYFDTYRIHLEQGIDL